MEYASVCLLQLELPESARHFIVDKPGVVECIDGTHARVLAPRQEEGACVHMKGFSLNNC